LTGEHPFDGETIPEVCAKVLSAEPPSVRAQRPDIDSRLDAVITCCLEKDPALRFPNVAALADALREFAPPPMTSASALTVPHSARHRRSRRSTPGSLTPFSEELRHQRSSFSGVLMTASAFVIAGVVTLALFAPESAQGLGALSWSKLERIELPGDPRLYPGPAPLPPSNVLELPPPALALRAASEPGSMPLTSDEANATPRAEPSLTAEEIRERTRRYENWLRQKGLKRVDEVTIDANNPY
jgi:serine/threonine-protein kinase